MQLKVFLTPLIVLSVGLKFVAFSQQPKIGDLAERKLQDLFYRSGYFVEKSAEGADPFYISATSGNCKMRVYIASPQGWHRDLISKLKLPSDRSFFMFDGVQYNEQPVWKTWFSYQRWRLGILFGQKPPIKPVLGVTVSPECNDDLVPWIEIAQVPI